MAELSEEKLGSAARRIEVQQDGSLNSKQGPRSGEVVVQEPASRMTLCGGQSINPRSRLRSKETPVRALNGTDDRARKHQEQQHTSNGWTIRRDHSVTKQEPGRNHSVTRCHQEQAASTGRSSAAQKNSRASQHR